MQRENKGLRIKDCSFSVVAVNQIHMFKYIGNYCTLNDLGKSKSNKIKLITKMPSCIHTFLQPKSNNGFYCRSNLLRKQSGILVASSETLRFYITHRTNWLQPLWICHISLWRHQRNNYIVLCINWFIWWIRYWNMHPSVPVNTDQHITMTIHIVRRETIRVAKLRWWSHGCV